MRYDLFEMSVTVPSSHSSLGARIPEYGLNNLTYVEGRKGQNFSLKLRNDSAGRVMAVISIDGLSVLDGQACTSESRGYLVPAYGSIEIKGWRTSLSEVRSFTFETKDKSYAQASTGQSQNCGVIGTKIFSEKAKPIPVVTVAEHHHHHHPTPVWPLLQPIFPDPHPPSYPRFWMGGATVTAKSVPNEAQYSSGPIATAGINSYATSANSMKMSNEGGRSISCTNFNLGTGIGEARRDTVQEVSFEKEREICTLTIYYADAASLEAVGVQLIKAPAIGLAPTQTLPQAFSGFCRIPAGI